jgi:hypothetical protein
MGGDGGLVRQRHLALHSCNILGKGGGGRIGNGGGHCRRRRGAEHEDIWGASNTPRVGGVYGKLDFTKDGPVRGRWESD